MGATTRAFLGLQVDVSNFGLGVCFLVCVAQLYRHAAWTKKIDLHKLWAYRVAGLCFGKLYARLLLLFMFMFLGEARLKTIASYIAATFITWTYYIPFLVLAEEVWRREQKQESVPSIIFLVAAVILLLIFTVGLLLQTVFLWMPLMGVNFDQNDGEPLFDHQ